jgi:hypothetical protein
MVREFRHDRRGFDARKKLQGLGRGGGACVDGWWTGLSGH